MRSRHTLSALAASTCLAAVAAAPAGARQSDLPLRPTAPAVRVADVRAIAAPAAARDAGGALRPAAASTAPAPASAPHAATLVTSTDGGLDTLSWALLAAGGGFALVGAAYLGARLAGRPPHIGAH